MSKTKLVLSLKMATPHHTTPITVCANSPVTTGGTNTQTENITHTVKLIYPQHCNFHINL